MGILQLLTISDAGWDDVKHAYIDEGLARLVPMIRHQYPHYRPLNPDIDASAAPLPDNPMSRWDLFEGSHGCERDPGSISAREVSPDIWLGRPRGWCSLTASPKQAHGQHAFSVRIRRLPNDAVVRLGWTVDMDVEPLQGWCYYSGARRFGGRSYKVHGARGWVRYGQRFRENDVITACVDRGTISFLRNGESLGTAFQGPADAEYRPMVSLFRQVEVELTLDDVDVENCFLTPSQIRSMAWNARLSKRSIMLIMFQVYFLSLVRPGKDGVPDWDALKAQYDRRLGFPSPEMSAALVRQFGEVHRVLSLTAEEGWSTVFRVLGFGELSDADVDRRLFAAFCRADALDYKMGG